MVQQQELWLLMVADSIAAVPLPVGLTGVTTIKVRVTARRLTRRRTYTINMTRQARVLGTDATWTS